MSKKIVHVVDSLTPGGYERVLIELVNELAHQQIEVGVCITRSNMRLAVELPPSTDVLVLGRRKTWDWTAIRRFLRYCKDNQISILHVHGRSTLMFCGLIKLLSGNRLRILFHDHFGGIRIDQSADPMLKWVCKNLVDVYIAVDPNLRDWAVNQLGISVERTHVLENAINLDRFQQTEDTDCSFKTSVEQPFIGVMVANLRPQKDHPLLFRALALSAYAKQKLHILLVGWDGEDEYSKKCRNLIHELGLEKNITLLGSRLDIPNILNCSDFGLLSSLSESGPVSLLEYMAAGLPFLITRTGYITKMVVQHMGQALCVEPENVEDYSQGLDTLIRLSEDEKREIGRIGQSLVTELFSIEKQTKKLINMYKYLEPKLGPG